MMMFIREAGWGIWPVLLFGVIGLALSLRYALTPAPRLLPLIVGFAVATIIVGCLGAVTGLQRSVGDLGRVLPERRWIFLLGLRESLNNVVAAFTTVGVVSLVAMVGGYRRACRAEAHERGTWPTRAVAP
jgi:hypothetical protein